MAREAFDLDPPEFYDDIEADGMEPDDYPDDYPDELTNEEYDRREDAYIAWMERGSR
jgi:hypothetical protein